MADVAKPQSCREMFVWLGAGNDKTLNAQQQVECQKIGTFMGGHPVLGQMLQHAILLRYQRATGVEVLSGATAIDWQALIAWFVANSGTIMNIVLTFMGLFGL